MISPEYGDHEWTVEFPVIRVIADFDDQYRSDATAFFAINGGRLRLRCGISTEPL
jgi:hypothetical protein